MNHFETEGIATELDNAKEKHLEHTHIISNEMIEYVSLLAQLELDGTEREQVKKDMAKILDYMDLLKGLDTEGVEPMTHIFPISNVFREDVVENGDNRENMLRNAPVPRNGSYQVPKAIE